MGGRSNGRRKQLKAEHPTSNIQHPTSNPAEQETKRLSRKEAGNRGSPEGTGHRQHLDRHLGGRGEE